MILGGTKSSPSQASRSISFSSSQSKLSSTPPSSRVAQEACSSPPARQFNAQWGRRLLITGCRMKGGVGGRTWEVSVEEKKEELIIRKWQGEQKRQKLDSAVKKIVWRDGHFAFYTRHFNISEESKTKQCCDEAPINQVEMTMVWWSSWEAPYMKRLQLGVWQIHHEARGAL